MSGSVFEFLQPEFPELFAEASLAERMALVNPRTTCFYSRRVVELALRWAFLHDKALAQPYEDKVSAMLHEPTFKALAGDRVFHLGKEVVRIGNRGAHDTAPVAERDAVASVSALFNFTYWFARTYTRGTKPAADLSFDPKLLPNPRVQAAKARAGAQAREQAVAEAEARAAESLAQVQALELQLAERDAAQKAERQRALAHASDRATLQAELDAVRAEVAMAKATALAVPDTHDYSETKTRDWIIDQLLAEAGWVLNNSQDREFKVTGMPDGKDGFVDYVLWGDDGLPLGLVEAKRTSRDARVGQRQAELYADRLEAQFGQRPAIFYTNGFEHWLWDDQRYPPRRVAGFYTKGELELLVQRRTSRLSLADTTLNTDIVERPYQHRAIRKIGEAFEHDNERKALVVMATGAGKTRTVIALADVLIRANWAKRVLFLADRTALVRQAVNAFKAHLPDSSPVNLVTERNEDGRVYVSTYPTMMGLIAARTDGEARFGPGHFDLVVIDEAHRSVFKKYKAIFDHFDSLLVGLTATPRDEIDRNTYSLFDLEDGVPTDAYSLAEAVGDGYLVPPVAVSVPLRFVREGIRYDELDEDAQEALEQGGWGDDDGPSDVTPAELNRWLFNADTVDKALEVLMTRGLKVAGGDRLGKTIIFARGEQHARFIAERFDANFPEHKGAFARVITHQTEFGETLIEQFSMKDSAPHIAISVDMLDTGIDVPEVVNLVFFKPVRSKIKFWQMIGRGTRLCPDLFGPGQDKESFQVFDLCQNFEFFNAHPDASDGSVASSVRERRFSARLDLLAALPPTADGAAALRRSVSDLLWREVGGMNLDNFVVRPHRRVVERFTDQTAWVNLDAEDLDALSGIAALPTAQAPEAVDTEEARRFDVLVLRLQLALLNTSPAFLTLRDQLKEIATLLEGYPTIPAVAAQLELIEEIQTDSWWESATLAQLETARTRLRALVRFIQKRDRKIVFLDVPDQLGELIEIPLSQLAPANEFERFRKKATAYLREHKAESAIAKIHHNWPITADDLAELQRVLIETGIATTADLERAQTEAGSFGVFVRSLVGLDRSAAKEAFASFLDGGTWTATQIDFVNLVIDALSQHGVIEPRRFYESPFTDLSPQGPEGLFTEPEIDRLVATLELVRSTAIGAA